MSYATGIFPQREPERQAMRNKIRTQFFDEVGIARMTDPFSLEPDPASQQALVMKLLEHTLNTHGDDVSGLGLLRQELAGLSLGVGGQKSVVTGTLRLQDMVLPGLKAQHFI